MPATPHSEHHFTAPEAVRDVVIGMSDGLTVPFALAAGISGAVASNPHAATLVVTAGLAEIAAGSIAMGLGGYLAARTDIEHYASERVPLEVVLEVTRRCPLECLHCYNNLEMGDVGARSRELSKEEYFKVLDELQEMGCFWLLFTGGEIFAESTAGLFDGWQRASLRSSCRTVSGYPRVALDCS